MVGMKMEMEAETFGYHDSEEKIQIWGFGIWNLVRSLGIEKEWLTYSILSLSCICVLCASESSQLLTVRICTR